MAQVIVTESSLQNIAGAIRAKLGTQATYKPAQMAGAIAQIHGDPVLEALNVNANGTYTPSSGKDGFSQAMVNVPNSYSASDEGKVVNNGALVAQGSQSITQNGTYDTTLKNQVTVNVSGGGSVLVPKTITQNGTYNPASDNADGYSQVVVNVSGGGNVESLIPVYEGLSYGYVADGKFVGWTTKTNYLLLFECDANETYVLFKIDKRGNRMRCAFFAEKSLSDFMNGINTPQSGDIYNGMEIISANDTASHAVKYTPSQNGILAVMTSSESVAAKAYCIKGLF